MAFVGVLVVALTAAQTIVGLDIGLLHLAPALVLLLPLIAGRYVGEDRLAALASPQRTQVRRGIAQAAPHSPARTRLRGGRLIAAVLVGRGPPRVLAIAR